MSDNRANPVKNMRILHLAILTISKTDIEKMEPHELAFVSTLAFAVDEVSVMQKLFSQSVFEQPKSEYALMAYAIQHNTIARILSSKLVEAIGLLEKYLRSRNGKRALEGCDVLQEANEKLMRLKERTAYRLAAYIRNNATNHYIPQESEKNIPFLSERVKYIAILDEMKGNSYYPFGEEVVFMGCIGRFFSEDSKRDYTIDDINDWYAWMASTSNWLSHLLERYLIWLRHTRFPHWKLQEEKPYLESEYFCELGERPLPLFLSVQKWKQRHSK